MSGLTAGDVQMLRAAGRILNGHGYLNTSHALGSLADRTGKLSPPEQPGHFCPPLSRNGPEGAGLDADSATGDRGTITEPAKSAILSTSAPVGRTVADVLRDNFGVRDVPLFFRVLSRIGGRWDGSRVSVVRRVDGPARVVNGAEFSGTRYETYTLDASTVDAIARAARE